MGAMGDILHALPAVTALRQSHPEWVIDWVLEPKWRSLLAAVGSTGRDTGSTGALQPVVDRLYFAPAKEWGRAPLAWETRAGIKGLRRALKSSAYDTVIDFQGAFRSAAFGRMAASRRLIGEAKPREWAARWLFTEHVATHGAHVIEQDLELAATVAGDDLKYVRPWLPTDPVADNWAQELLRDCAGKPVALINPGAGWGAKCWPLDRYAAVARKLIERGFWVLVNAGPGEEPLANSIVQKANGAAVALSPSLERLIAITRRISLVIAGDTGPLHLACALGKPVVGIYGPTDPSRNGPFGARFKVLRHPESRRDHTRYEEPEPGLLTIQPEQVLEAAQELICSEAAR